MSEGEVKRAANRQIVDNLNRVSELLQQQGEYVDEMSTPDTTPLKLELLTFHYEQVEQEIANLRKENHEIKLLHGFN